MRRQHRAPDYVILEASTGETGLALYRAHPVSCVVLELDLPDMSGSKVLVNLVPCPRHKEVAVIMLTRQALSEERVNVLRKNGGHTWLFKAHASGEELHRLIETSMATLGPMHKEPRSELSVKLNRAAFSWGDPKRSMEWDG